MEQESTKIIMVVGIGSVSFPKHIALLLAGRLQNDPWASGASFAETYGLHYQSFNLGRCGLPYHQQSGWVDGRRLSSHTATLKLTSYHQEDKCVLWICFQVLYNPSGSPNLTAEKTCGEPWDRICKNPWIHVTVYQERGWGPREKTDL